MLGMFLDIKPSASSPSAAAADCGRSRIDRIQFGVLTPSTFDRDVHPPVGVGLMICARFQG
jgi:hypothetical protein